MNKKVVLTFFVSSMLFSALLGILFITLTIDTVSATQWTGLWNPTGVAIGDFDNDGLNDIAIAEYELAPSQPGRVTVYKSDGTTMIKQWTGLWNPNDVAIGDYDNDGLNEIAIVELGEHAVVGGRVTLYYQLTVTSSPITGITFTVNGTPQTTPYTEWPPGGSYTLEMPQTQNGYVWSRWLEDGDTNRIKTITLPGTTWTAVYVPAPPPPPPPPVGGKATPINIPTNKPETPALWIWLSTIILPLIATAVFIKHKKKKQ